MKTFILFLSLATLLVFYKLNTTDKTGSVSHPEKTATLTFDGFEGGHYFFTNDQDQAMSFDSIATLSKYKSGLENGEYVRETFKVVYLQTQPHNFNNIITEIAVAKAMKD